MDQRFVFIELRMKFREVDKLHVLNPNCWSDQPGIVQGCWNRLRDLQQLQTSSAKPDSPAIAEERQREMSAASNQLFQIEEDNRNCLLRCRQLDTTLGSFGGQGSWLNTKQFPFISNSDLRQIIERDYRSLIIELIPSGAWKSAVVMAGSILEAILYDQLTKDSAQVARAMASPKAPTRNGTVKSLTNDEWVLANLVEVSADLGILPQARADAIDQVLRDYRNFVHPRKEIRAGHPCTEAEADLAKGALGAVINHLTP